MWVLGLELFYLQEQPVLLTMEHLSSPQGGLEINVKGRGRGEVPLGLTGAYVPVGQHRTLLEVLLLK